MPLALNLTPRSGDLAAEAASSPGAPSFARGGTFKRRVFRLVLAEKAGVKWIVGGALAESIFSLAGPWLSSRVIDVALPNQATHMLGLTVLLVVVVALHTAWAGWLHDKVKVILSARVEAECLELVLERLLQARFELSERRNFGETRETMSAVSATTGALIRAIATITTQSLGAALLLGFLALWFPALAVAVMAAALLMVLVAGYYAMQEATRAESTIHASSRQQQTLHVLLRAVATLRVSGATERFLALWRGRLARQTHAMIAQQGSYVSQGVVLEAFPQLVALGATAWLVSDVMARNASLGEMMMGTMLVGNVMGAFVALAGTAVAFQALRPQFDRIDELLTEGEQPGAARRSSPAGSGDRGDLVLDGVWFRYREAGRWVLADRSCRFPSDQVTELRAVSGAGKTTILRLLTGLLKPERGVVRVLGRVPHETRGLVTYLPQQSALLEASIATNLRVLSGRPLEESLEVGKHTGLAHLLERLPMHEETWVSIAGGNLSAGQRQLILLTAAFASGRRVLLLDEATSQLDPESQRRIDWNALTRGKTVVLVRHD